MKILKIFIFVMILIVGVVEILAIVRGIDGKFYGLLISFYSFVIGKYWNDLKKKIRGILF